MNKCKRLIVRSGIICIIGFLYFFFAQNGFYGEIQFTELKHNGIDYEIVATRLGINENIVFKMSPTDKLEIVIDSNYSKSSIVTIWDDLKENQPYHVYYRSYRYRDRFKLEKIYLD